MKNIVIPMCALAALLAATALTAGCSSTAQDTNDPKWRYENTYDDLGELLSRIEDHFDNLQDASYDLNLMAMRADSLAWDAEVIAALAPHMRGLTEGPTATDPTFWGSVEMIARCAEDARHALLYGNWELARAKINRIGSQLEIIQKDYDPR